jgi:hypothetical protein
MAGKDITVKKYVVRLSPVERARLVSLIGKGKSPARRQLKARIWLKADVLDASEGSDGKIVEALETNALMDYRVRKQRATLAVPPICDGQKEAKLIALACSTPPKRRARWSLRLLKNKVVELGIAERASDSTIGRV